MSTSNLPYRLARRAGQQGARPPVGGQAGVEKYVTGCSSLSLLTNPSGTGNIPTDLVTRNTSGKKSSKLVVAKNAISKNITYTNTSNIKISTLNMQTLTCDIKLSTTIKSASELKLDIFALQEVRRKGTGEIEFENESIKGWKMVWCGYKSKTEGGVAFLIAPHVNLVETLFQMSGRIISVCVVVKGLRLSLINGYAPHNEHSESSKTLFYRELQKSRAEVLKYTKFKPVLLGDFNATIGMKSKVSGAWDSILGSNNPDKLETNENGELFLKFCSENKMKIMNSIFRSKRIHRGTWLNPRTKLKKRIDYICAGSFVARFAKSCRVYLGPSKEFDTDHFLLVMELQFPKKKKQLKQEIKKTRQHKKSSKPDVSVLYENPTKCDEYSTKLDELLDPAKLPDSVDDLNNIIKDSICISIEEVCPKIDNKRSTKDPWEDDELKEMIKEQRATKSRTDLRLLQKRIKEKRKDLKNAYYKSKAEEINNAAEARKVEKEFSLCAKYSMHKSSQKSYISKEKLKDHFEQHFSGKELPVPPEIEHPEQYIYLKDKVEYSIDESAPTKKEVEDVMKSFKNGKSSGTDKVPLEALKYQNSQNLLRTMLLLFTSIWTLIRVPTSWLHSNIVCLYKKGIKSLAKNYRGLSIGANISRILPQIILNRISKSYEANIEENQFGFRKGRSTTDAIFILNTTLRKCNGRIITIFIDLTAAYDHIPRDFLFRVVTFRTGSKLLIGLLKKLYEGTTATIVGSKAKFDVLSGCRQGGVESPTLFNYYFDFVLKVCAEEIDRQFPNGWGIPFSYRIPTECSNRKQRAESGGLSGTDIMRWILYADDLVLFCKEVEDAQQILEIIHVTCTRFGLNISFGKTKTLVFRDDELASKESILTVADENIGNVSEFCYLGHMISNKPEYSYTDLRISSATKKFYQLCNVLCDHQINKNTRKKIMEACVRSRLTYGTQACTPNAKELRSLESCWYGFLRRMMRGGWRRKKEAEDEEKNYEFVFSNIRLEHQFNLTPLRDFINVQYLRYTAHICRQSNSSLTKKSMCMIPTMKYFRDPWTKICVLLGGISANQAKRATQVKSSFNSLLARNFEYLRKTALKRK